MERIIRKKRFRADEADIIVGIYALKNNMTDVFDTDESQLVLEAIRRSTTALDDESDIKEIQSYVEQFNEVQIDGMVNNIKGIYHELYYEFLEDNDGDVINAELFEETNHADSDIILVNVETGEREFVQLKATNDIYYVRDAIEKNPDIRVLTTEEVADKLGIDSTGLSNEELNQEVENILDELKDSNDLFDELPKMSIWTTIFSVMPIIQDMLRRRISKSEAIRRIVKITGLKTLKVITLVALLSFPLTAFPTSIYMIMKYSVLVYEVLLKK